MTSERTLESLEKEYNNPPLYCSRLWLPRFFWWSDKDGIAWWDGPTVSAPEEAEIWMRDNFPRYPYVLVEVTRVERVADVSRMAYKPGSPLYGISLRAPAGSPPSDVRVVLSPLRLGS